MNKKISFTWLVLVAMILVSGCTPAPTATVPPASQAPTEPAPTEPATEAPTPPTAVATEAPTVQPPASPVIPTVDKPPLSFSQNIDIDPKNLQPIIGYTFPADTPDWTVPLKTAAFANINPAEIGKTRVAVVEVGGEKPDVAGIYEVWIDLSTGAGELHPIPTGSPQSIEFDVIPQQVNPARLTSPFKEIPGLVDVPSSASAINANGVCFVVQIDDKPTYARYCSKPGTILSVQQNFTDQYGSLKASMEEVTAGLPAELKDHILYEAIISEMEDPQHLEGCRDQITASIGVEQTAESQQAMKSVCSSDIAVAPLDQEVPVETASQLIPAGGQFMFASVLTSLFKQAVPPQKTVAIVQVHHPINTGQTAIAPGTYRLDYWYEADGTTFHSATITGISPEVSQVINQQIPAVPATFVNEDPNSQQPAAQISVCRVFGICTFFQKSCS